MEPHQQRVIDEQRELNDKLSKLSSFMATTSFVELVQMDERKRLIVQQAIMKKYNAILCDRIKAFTIDTTSK